MIQLSHLVFLAPSNDRNILTQDIATLLVATCCTHLATHPVVTCGDMLNVVGSSLKMEKFFMQHLWMLHDVVPVWPGSCNNVAPEHAHCFELQHPACRNTPQQGSQTRATCYAQQVAICCVEMLPSFGRGLQTLGQQCCDMLR